jgi:L-asparaginase
MVPRIAFFSLGGTIASMDSANNGAHVTLTGSDLVSTVSEASAFRIEVHNFRQVPSGDLTMEDIVTLAGDIDAAFEAGADGVVVSQGTDTLEETAYVLDLLVAQENPIVVTGAMRNPSLPGADGTANLQAALRVAASGATAGLGAVAVLNDEIHAARFVRKRHTTSVATFGSPLTGPLGYVSEGRVEVFMKPTGRMLVRLPADPMASRVGMLTLGFDDDVDMVPSAEKYDGLVVAAFGGGHAPSRMSASLETLAGRIPVVLASRTFAGPMLTNTYAYGGSEMDLLSRGLISAGALDAVHARVLLRLLLMARTSYARITDTFARALTLAAKEIIEPVGVCHG